MVERLSFTEHARRARDIGKLMLLGVLDAIDRHYADAINNPADEYPRIYVDQVEAPCATEEELSLPRHDGEAVA